MGTFIITVLQHDQIMELKMIDVKFHNASSKQFHWCPVIPTKKETARRVQLWRAVYL